MPVWLDEQIASARKQRYDVIDEEKCKKQVEMTQKHLDELEESGMVSSKIKPFNLFQSKTESLSTSSNWAPKP